MSTTVQIDGKPVPVGTAAAFEKLAAAFKKKFGLTLHVRSGLRTRAEQQRLYDLYLAGKGNLAARPGTSRHEKGHALDVYDSGSDFGVTRANNVRSNWLKANASKYGFDAAGYRFRQTEPWHIEFTGDPWKAPKKPKPKPKPHVKPAVGGDWLTVTSWNISLGNTKGIAGWLKNRVKVGNRIHGDRADIVFLQEAYWSTALGHHGLAWLSKNLDGYRLVRHRSGRAILVRDSARVLAMAEYRPKTKAVGHPTKYGVMAVVEILGVKSLVVNAHAQAGAKHSNVRRKWARELAAMVEASRVWHEISPLNVIIGGDWNGREAAEEFAAYGYIDAFDNAHESSAAGIKSLNSWKPKSTTGTRIDYIMIHEKRPVIKASQRNDSDVTDHNRQMIKLGRIRK